MKKLNALCLLISITQFGLTQTNDSLISGTTIKVSFIDRHLDQFDTITVYFYKESTEDGLVKGFFQDDTIAKMDVTWYGEMGKTTVHYYFEHDSLFYAFEQNFNYNRPIYMDQKKAKEMGDSTVFDPSLTIVKEHFYYFIDQMLVLYLDEHKKEVDLSLGTNTLIGSGLITDSNDKKKLLIE